MKLKEFFTMVYLITTIFFNSFYVNADVFEFLENGADVEWTWEDKKQSLIDHMEDLIIEGKNFGKITSAGRKAIIENRLDDFYPYCDEEAQTIKAYKEYASSNAIVQNQPTEQNKPDNSTTSKINVIIFNIAIITLIMGLSLFLGYIIGKSKKFNKKNKVKIYITQKPRNIKLNGKKHKHK